MRRLIFLLTFFFLTGLSFSQVSVSLQQPPPNQLRGADLWKGILINTTQTTFHITLSGTLESAQDGIVIEGNSRLISLPPGVKRITYDDIKTGNVNFKSPKWSEEFNRTGNAPPGDYIICLQVKEESGKEVGNGCIDQTIVSVVQEDVTPHFTVKLIPPPPNQLKSIDLWRIIVTNASAVSFTAPLISVELKENSTGLQAESKLRSVSISGTKTLSFNDFNSADLSYRNTRLQEAFSRNMNAPDGDYTICVYIKNERGEEFASDCIDQTILTPVPVDLTPQLTIKLLPLVPNKLMQSDLFRCIVTNLNPVAYKASIITVELRENSAGLQAESKLRSVLISGTKTLSFNDFNSADLSYRNTRLQEAFSRNMNAPDGDYTICVYIKNERGEVLASDCIDQTIATVVAEESNLHLISPADESILESNQPILFSWMFPSVKPDMEINYSLKVVEILGAQSPSEAIKRNPAWFEKNDIKTTILQYPVSAKKIEADKRYAWTILPVHREGKTVGENANKSEVFSFDVDVQNGITKSLTIPDTTDSTLTSGGTGTVAVGDTIKAGLNGEFKVIVFQVTTESDSSLTGKGKTYVKWLMTNVAVEFKKIRVDTTKRLTSGGIVSTQSGSTGTSWTTYPLAWALSLTSGPGGAYVVDHTMTWSNNLVENVVDWTVNSVTGYPIMHYQSNIIPPPIPDNSLKMPFGLQFNNGNQKLVITEMIFKPNESKINFLAQEQFTKGGTVYKLGFVGKYFKMHPARIEFANGRVELAQDFTIPNTSSAPKMKFNFKKGTANSGCYVEWDSTGVKDIGLALEVKFTRDWLLPTTAPLTDSVKATITGNGTSMHDILLTGSLTGCEIVGTNGIKIAATPMSLDLSDIRNPVDMYFPNNYPNDSTVTWKGFYVKSFDVTLPDTWKTGTNLTPPVVSANNFIIDDFGLTTKIKAVNIFNLQSGRVADLSASLDTVEVSIISNSLVSGSANGVLVLPISEVTTQNSLKYSATFAQVSSSNSFQIAITPLGPIDADILKGKLTLKPTSNISALVSPTSKTLSINLNGTFKWDNPDLSAASINAGTSGPTRAAGIKGVKMEMAFENLGLTYSNSTTTNTLAFNPGTWSFASPPKWLSNFPVSITKVYYKSLTKASLPSPNMELLRGALMIDIVANLTENIGGTTTVGAAFAVEFNKSTIKFAPKFKGVFIDSLSVHADLPAVKIDGYLKLFEDDPKYGSGFNAGLDVTFTAVSLQANALVQFGNTAYQNNNQYYRYWRVEADVILPVGIPFLTGVGFYGFGGGAYYNMEAILKTGTTNVTNAYTFEPRKGYKGLKVSATIGTMPKVETFNADVSLSAQFNNNNGLDLIYFEGDFWLATKLAERANSKIYGGVVVSYTFPTKVFYMGADLNINVTENGTNVISTPPSQPVQFTMKIDGRNNKWYFKFGEPLLPNTVNIFTFSLYSYLMFGNDIPAPTGFTPRFQQKYFEAIGGYPTPSGAIGGVGSATSTGKGIATGVGIEFDKTFNRNIHKGLCRKWSIEAQLKVGAELNLAFMDYPNSPCPGINGYRASGNVGLYFDLSSRIRGVCYRCTSAPLNYSDVDYALFTIKIGAWLTGEFPNPVYLYGSVAGTINAMNDLISMPFNESFTYGTSCDGGAADIATGGVQEDKAADLLNKMIQHVTPASRYDFPINSTVNVKYALVPNQVFDVAENQSDGSIKNRTFKMVITKSLEVQNPNGTWTAKTLLSKVSNVGEWQYYVKAPISTVVGQASGQTANLIASPIHSNTANTNTPALMQPSLQHATLTPSTTAINANNGNALFSAGSSNFAIAFTHLPYPIPPPPVPNYPNPIPNPVNNLVSDMEYRFIVTAELKEGITSGNTIIWSTAMTGTNNPAPVKETKTVLFRTGTQPLVQASNAGSQVR